MTIPTVKKISPKLGRAVSFACPHYPPSSTHAHAKLLHYLCSPSDRTTTSICHVCCSHSPSKANTPDTPLHTTSSATPVNGRNTDPKIHGLDLLPVFGVTEGSHTSHPLKSKMFAFVICRRCQGSLIHHSLLSLFDFFDRQSWVSQWWQADLAAPSLCTTGGCPERYHCKFYSVTRANQPLIGASKAVTMTDLLFPISEQKLGQIVDVVDACNRSFAMTTASIRLPQIFELPTPRRTA